MNADAFLQARLFPDMFPLVKQVQIACDFARGVSARLAGVDVPAHESNEATFADLDALLAMTLAFIDGLDAAKFDGAESRDDRAAPRHAQGTQARRPGLPVQLRPAAVLLPRDDGLRDPAPQRRGRSARRTTWARTDAQRQARASAGRA